MNILKFFKLTTLWIWLLGLIVFTGLSTLILFTFVDLKPQVEPNFFFADTDPQFRNDLKIREIFPEPEQIILAAKGPVHDADYQNKIRSLSNELLALPPIFAAQSLSHGPENIESAFESPLWRRVVLSPNEDSSLIVLYTHAIPDEQTYLDIENIASTYEDPDFSVVVSGAPYVVDLIRRYLHRDLKTFSLAAFGIFAFIMLIIFRSMRILLGTIVACANASIATLIAAQVFNIGIGPLTANVSTIVFVLTLSHIAYMTFNWKHSIENPAAIPKHPVLHAVHVTISPSFWSMLTTFLGFVTLIFVEAAPFKKLGISGSVGTLIAFCSAYLLYPWFLVWKTPSPGRNPTSKPSGKFLNQFLTRQHPLLTTLVFVGVIAAAFGLAKIERDPHLLSYFKSGTVLRDGLDYIDTNWGSNPLKVVIRDKDNRLFNTKEVQSQLLDLQEVLEDYQPVGSVVSLPLITDEGKSQARIPFLVSRERVIKELAKPKYDEISKQFVTDDRAQSLLLLRLKSLERTEPRMMVIDKIKTMIWAKGFTPELVGGLYLLQGEMGTVVISSLLMGLGMLILLFFCMGLFLSHSLHITGALFLSLIIIPVWLLGLFGHLNIPLDMISAPAANLAIAMGVDAMIHMLLMVRRLHREDMVAWDAWVEARLRLWKPVLTSAVLVCTGFGIFTLSYFPPTQRFGVSVISGSLMACISVLFILPTFSGTASNLSSSFYSKKAS